MNVPSTIPATKSGDIGFPEKLASVVGGSVHGESVYGQPVEREGITVIPVARLRYGFGGGGKKTDGREGGGGGAQVHPVGFISIRGGSAEFRSIPDPTADAGKVLALFVGAGLGALLLFRGIRALFRR